MSHSIWFITGCSHGLGYILTKTLLAQEHKVIACTRVPEHLNELVNQYGSHILPIKLDVTNKQQILDAVSKGISTFGQIDVLVNNAGNGVVGAIEEIKENDLRDLMEVNFFGPFSVIQAVLPHMRNQHSGYIFNVIGLAGLVGTQGIGAFNAAKFALCGLTEALHSELEPLGIHVALIEPGPMRTGFLTHSVKTSEKINDYDNSRGLIATAIRQYDGKEPGDPQLVANIIIRIASNPVLPLHHLMGKFAAERLREKILLLNEAVQYAENDGLVDYK
jgi:NAD(P)-dependent dehydrogenase (short-subunit alcohol dehydrogenase family)